MNLGYISKELVRNKDLFSKLLSGVSQDEYLWRNGPKKWCLLEIVCHLYDEEREDFKARIKHVLEASKGPFPDNDPEGWVTQRNYLNRNYPEMLQKFLYEREQSVKWLRSLENHDWGRSYDHPKFGRMTAGTFLANWLAHDYLHIRQILRLKFDYLHSITGENLNYAGEWKS